ncbi:signal peptidase I [Salinisphaera sp. P385]|uniref:Signal peptidase I n=1 Tax=Spectribacter acetivorans TaxID=3075603 RepID=A0ABU3B3X7_9GAMM|nr:signal peptidase I [Salinisphaera sp. P385]MDT0616863.1 signal peptidase I [Salinisphaera sp. P385]
MNDLHFDFEVGLLLATVVTGIVWALDRWWLAKRRAENSGAGMVVEFSRSFFPVILAVLILRSFVVEPFRIPSSSMVPTLLEGDFIVVNKFGYGLRLPGLHTEFVDFGEPERGDVIVFRWPEDPSKDFIKRVVGLPGDDILYRDKMLFINGEEVAMERLGEYSGPGISPLQSAVEFRETLGEHTHNLLNTRGRELPALRYEVPAGHYFVMGDNRDHSSDSRVWGFVPERMLVGRAFMIWMSVSFDPFRVRFDRLGSLIH